MSQARGLLRDKRMIIASALGVVVAIAVAVGGTGAARVRQPDYCSSSCHVEMASDPTHASHPDSQWLPQTGNLHHHRQTVTGNNKVIRQPQQRKVGIIAVIWLPAIQSAI